VTPTAPENMTGRPFQRPPGLNIASDPAAVQRRALWTVIKVIELRLRFVALMAATWLAFAYGDTLWNHYEKWTRRPGLRAEASPGFESFCPMHPSVVQERPGNCPTCGMPLSRRKQGEAQALPEGVTARVELSPIRLAQAGVRTVEVGYSRPASRLTTVGVVGFDESRRVVVASEARGRLRVDRLHVSSEGVPVRAGQRLAELSGYDVAQACRVFLEARRALQNASETPNDPRRTPLGDPDERVRLAVQGLKVLGVRQEQIDAIADGDGPGERLPLLAPIDGQVIRKEVYEGQYVAEGTVLFEIADLSRVWVDARVFEDQLGCVEVGLPAEATVPAFPGVEFKGCVTLIAPALDPATRTAAVRFELDNRSHRLRPGMFATVVLNVSQGGQNPRQQSVCPVTRRRLGSMGPAVRVEVGERTVWVCCTGCIPKLESAPAMDLAQPVTKPGDGILSVPESAVIDTGSSRVVYVESGPGTFEGRAVTLGPLSIGEYPVLDGLAPGERVAAAGAFLIDSETRLNPSTRLAPALHKVTSRSPSATPQRPTIAATRPRS
jgi:Cu(I)/Ag(I) efflux system membrane fusion protein